MTVEINQLTIYEHVMHVYNKQYNDNGNDYLYINHSKIINQFVIEMQEERISMNDYLT